MNQGAREANEESYRAASRNREERQISLLTEIRDLLRELIVHANAESYGITRSAARSLIESSDVPAQVTPPNV